MSYSQLRRCTRFIAGAVVGALLAATTTAQLTDITQTPNATNAGIQRSLSEQVGVGRGDEFTPNSSAYLIQRDPFRAIARGRQLFQRKFTQAQGLGPRAGDGVGDIQSSAAFGAGLSDSCAACHGRPRGAAGVGGNVFTRPESRDAPHLFGLGLIEMLGDEITSDLRALRADALTAASQTGLPATRALTSKGVDYGLITALPSGAVDTTRVRGVDADLRVRPFFAQGGLFSIREFAVGAFAAEMGLQAFDRDLLAAATGHSSVTPAGLKLDGSLDVVGRSPALSRADDPDADGVRDEVATSVLDYLEFYLLNYFAPATGRSSPAADHGRVVFAQIGCAQCHVPDLLIDRDRRVADVLTQYDPTRANGVFNQLFATAALKHASVDDGSGLPTLKPPLAQPFLVRDVLADFRRHDLGPGFHERNFDGSVQTQFMTEPLWGVASTAPYGHDGRSATLEDVIVRHGGEAQTARDLFATAPRSDRDDLIAFLDTLMLFGPPDTSSNLDPADPLDANFPMSRHGSIDLSVLFVSPAVKE